MAIKTTIKLIYANVSEIKNKFFLEKGKNVHFLKLQPDED